MLQCLDAEFDYGYEYIGSSNREVITPLTERVFVALCQSIRAHMGGMCVGAMVRESYILEIYNDSKLQLILLLFKKCTVNRMSLINRGEISFRLYITSRFYYIL